MAHCRLASQQPTPGASPVRQGGQRPLHEIHIARAPLALMPCLLHHSHLQGAGGARAGGQGWAWEAGRGGQQAGSMLLAGPRPPRMGGLGCIAGCCIGTAALLHAHPVAHHGRHTQHVPHSAHSAPHCSTAAAPLRPRGCTCGSGRAGTAAARLGSCYQWHAGKARRCPPLPQPEQGWWERSRRGRQGGRRGRQGGRRPHLLKWRAMSSQSSSPSGGCCGMMRSRNARSSASLQTKQAREDKGGSGVVKKQARRGTECDAPLAGAGQQPLGWLARGNSNTARGGTGRL